MNAHTDIEKTEDIRWRAWYADGSVLDSNDFDWADIPDDGIVSVVIYGDIIPDVDESKRYRRIMDGDDLYFFFKDTIICNNLSLEENKKRYPEAKHFKRGKWVSDAQFRSISKQTMASTWQ